MDEGFGERLKVTIEAVGSRKAASEIAGVSTDQLAKWQDGRARASFPALAALARAAGRSLDWLAYGGDDPGPEPSALVQVSTTSVDLDEQEFAVIRQLNVRASAGRGVVPFTEEVRRSFAFRRDWLRSLGVNPDLASIIAAEGDSMEPTIFDSDPMLVNHAITEVRNGNIYALQIRGDLLVKRIQVKTDGSLVLISDNAKYESETLAEDKAAALHVVGRVQWVWRSL